MVVAPGELKHLSREEKKANAIRLVAASETRSAQTVEIYLGGVVGLQHGTE